MPKQQSTLDIEQTNTPFYLGGIQVNEASMEDWTNTLTTVGMNTVEVTVYGKQWYWNTDGFEFDEYAENEIAEIRAAKKKGLKVVLILRIQLQHWYEDNRFLWHGMIMPNNKDLESWFEKYTAFALQWAKICEAEGVDVFVIGSEMNALVSTMPIAEMPPLYEYYNNWWKLSLHEKRILKYKEILHEKDLWIPAFNGDRSKKDWLDDYVNAKVEALHTWGKMVTFADQSNGIELMNQRRKTIQQSWIQLIGTVRKVYQGQVTYAANYDNYQDVAFWEYLDFMAINAYFPLRKPTVDLPPKAELTTTFEKSWLEVFKTINEFKQQQQLMDKPLLFTELGYTNYINSTVESWSGNGFVLLGPVENEHLAIWKEQQKAPEERILAIKALKKITDTYPTDLQGILYWKLTTHDYLLKEEGFALHIASPPTDSLQVVLRGFVED